MRVRDRIAMWWLFRDPIDRMFLLAIAFLVPLVAGVVAHVWWPAITDQISEVIGWICTLGFTALAALFWFWGLRK